MRKILVVVAALALVGGACKGKSDTSTLEGGATATTAASDDSSGGPSGNPALRSKLLTVADLPAGYSVSDNGGDDRDDEDTSSSGCPALDEYDEKYSKAADEDAEIDFEKGEISDTGEFPAGGLQFLNQSVEEWSSDSKADESFDAAVAAFNECKTFNTTDDDGSVITGTMSPLSFPKVEDDTFAVHIKFSVSSEGQKIDFDGDMVAVRAGKFVSLVLAMTFAGPAMPAADFESVVRKAAAKL